MTMNRRIGVIFGVVALLAGCTSPAPENAMPETEAAEPAESGLEPEPAESGLEPEPAESGLEPEPAQPPVSLYHEARESAANFAALYRESGIDIQNNARWLVEEVMTDEFTDRRGQAAWLLGQNARLTLIVGCSDNRISGVAVGGLGGNRIYTRTPMLLFQDGNVDLRWADGDIVSTVWRDGDEVLLLSGRRVAEFVDAASQENRLRMRATVARNSIVNDEFDLRNLDVTIDTIQLRDPDHSDGPQELTCALLN